MSLLESLEEMFDASSQELSSWPISQSAKQELLLFPGTVNRLHDARRAGILMLPMGTSINLEIRCDGACYLLAHLIGLGDPDKEHVDIRYIQPIPKEDSPNLIEILIDDETVFLDVNTETVLDRLESAMLLSKRLLSH